jgi:hypothetical protein
MATYTKVKLSGSTDGKPVKIAATATAGTTVHTAHATALDEIWIWLTNTDTSDRTVTIEFGSVTDPDGLILKTVTLPANSFPTPVITGQILTNSMVVGIFASSANKVLATGYVNRVTP